MRIYNTDIMKRVMSNHLEDYFVDKDVMLKKSDKLMRTINDIIMKSDFIVEEGFISRDSMIMYFKTKFHYGENEDDKKDLTLVFDYSKYSDTFCIDTWNGKKYENLPNDNYEDDKNVIEVINSKIKYGHFYLNDTPVEDEYHICNSFCYYERGYLYKTDNFSKKIYLLGNILQEVSEVLKTNYPILDKELLEEIEDEGFYYKKIFQM